MEKNTSNEIDLLLNNLRWFKGQMPSILVSWRQDNARRYPKGCGEVVFYYNESKNQKDVINRLCENPNSYLQTFDSLDVWLQTYKSMINREISMTGQSLDFFLIRGIRLIHDYVVISVYFGIRPELITMDKQKQDYYRKILLTSAMRLIGCANANFPFISLTNSIKSLQQDVAQMKTYLSNQCSILRIKLLE